MESPRVTAICCAYNYARWLPRALESALAQGVGSETLEVVVVDDGSTDNTAEIVKPYLDSPLIRYVWKPNGGFASAVSRGIDEARGSYITFLDADDEWPANRLPAQIAALDENPLVGLVYSDMELIDEESQLLHPSFHTLAKLPNPSGQLLDQIVVSNFVSGGSMMFRAELSEMYNPIPSQIRCQDWWIATRIAMVAEILWVPALVYRYRQHGQNMNLGQADRSGNYRDDREFRRLILARPETDMISLGTLLLASAPLVSSPIELRELVHVSPQERELSQALETEALDLVRARSFDQALRTLVRAQAADPTALRQPLFEQAVQLLNAQTEGFPEDVETRQLRVLAFAAELIERPQLLAEAAEALTGEDATIVCQVVSEGDLTGLVALAEAAAPQVDMVAVTFDQAKLAACCDVLLSGVDQPGLFTFMPRLETAAGLRLALNGIS